MWGTKEQNINDIRDLDAVSGVSIVLGLPLCHTSDMTEQPKTGPRLVVTLTPEQFHDVHNLAYRSQSSVSQIVQLAVVQLLLDAETGKHPLLPEYRRGIDPGHA